MIQVYVSHSRDIDYAAELYTPLKLSALSAKIAFFFPHENGDMNTHEQVRSSTYVFAEVSKPSLGQGIELGWADAAGVQIVAFSKEGSRVSGSLAYVTPDHFEYADREELIAKLTNFCKQKGLYKK